MTAPIPNRTPQGRLFELPRAFATSSHGAKEVHVLRSAASEILRDVEIELSLFRDGIDAVAKAGGTIAFPRPASSGRSVLVKFPDSPAIASDTIEGALRAVLAVMHK